MRYRLTALSPPAVLAVALAASAAFGLFAYAVAGIRDPGFLLYVSLVGVPFVAFAHERLARWPDLGRSQRALDAPVIAVALIRGLGLIPFVSGHAMFLAYALWTGRAPLVRWTALAVLAQVAYVKGFGADRTLWWGLLAGSLAGVLWLALDRRPGQPGRSSG